MRTLGVVCLLLVAPGVIWAQASSPKGDSPPNNLEQAADLKSLRDALLQTQKQLASQQEEIKELKQLLSARQPGSASLQAEGPRVINAALPSSDQSVSTYVAASTGTPPVAQYGQAKPNEQESPLSFKLGDAIFTPGGFVDLENIYRTTNTQGNIATPFFSIPFSNTPQGHLTEYRLTGQYSRVSLLITDKVFSNDVSAYCEADFSGNDAANVYQVVNGHTLRLRLCFMDLKRGNWEFMGGQTWSWLTPNRDGVGPMLQDLFLTFNEDQNVQVGLPFTRAAEFRVAYHPNEHWAMGVGIEATNQFIGGFVALPAAFSTVVSPQFDNGAQVGAPNLFPDVLAKIAHDSTIAGRHFHWEVDGLITGARAGVFPAGSPFSGHSAVGGGGEIAANYHLFHNFTLMGNAFWSDGGAHYLVVTGPQLVIRPNAAGTNISPSLVHAGAALGGFEWLANSRTAISAYYGADYYGRNFFVDTTNTAHPGTIIGFGGPGSPSTNNRTVEEATLDWLETFWKSDRFGALQYYTQYSYVGRAPWFVAPGNPKNAHLSMVYAGFRYVFPSTPGTLLRVPYPESK
jgi:hypothetical protein